AMLEDMVHRARRSLAIGVDARTTGFDAALVLEALARLRTEAGLRAELVYVWAEDATLQRRFSETRRRHPLAPQGRVTDGIAREQTLIGPLRDAADLVLDTSDLPLGAMRELIERRYNGPNATAAPGLSLSLISFSYAHGLPRDADMVFDARFLRNPHYDPILRPRTGLDADVAAYIEADPDFPAFLRTIQGLLELLLPRFIQEGKKYATIAVGCTGGRHRSVYIIERLAQVLRSDEAGVRLHVAHRELAREGLSSAFLADRAAASDDKPKA
ncbi:MAG: RNase adapter RapZ, partial [Acetobacteraceae bacterium]